MGKRFTETTKWDDAWFVELPTEFKLAWLYCCDCCDSAGVLDLSPKLANFRIGCIVDWDAFVIATDGRIERLGKTKLWIVGFVSFQFGNLSSECKAHNGIFASLKKHGLLERVSKGYPKGIQRDQDKDKETDKDKDKDGGVGETSDWEVPEHLDCQDVRDALEAFRLMRSKIKKPIKDLRSSSRILKQFKTIPHLLACLDVAISSEYQGLKPEYAKAPVELQKSFGQRALEAQW